MTKTGGPTSICRCLTNCAWFITATFCNPDPCENGGTCTEGEDTHVCICVEGYEGVNCQTSRHLHTLHLHLTKYTNNLYNIYTMLDQRQRRWADIV